MKPGAVIIDVCIDQGGCVETSRPTTHADPTYVEEGIVHYCVTNMPGAVGRTSTHALCNVTFPYVLRLAESGLDAACQADPGLVDAVNMHAGEMTNQAVAETFGMRWREFTGVRKSGHVFKSHCIARINHHGTHEIDGKPCAAVRSGDDRSCSRMNTLLFQITGDEESASSLSVSSVFSVVPHASFGLAH